jgi:hypothetical protein
MAEDQAALPWDADTCVSNPAISKQRIPCLEILVFGNHCDIPPIGVETPKPIAWRLVYDKLNDRRGNCAIPQATIPSPQLAQ